MIRNYTELSRLGSYEERFRYLSLQGVPGRKTFGTERYLNQLFYRSTQWRHIRQRIIARDNGCDLAHYDYELHAKIIIHHMNPMTIEDLKTGDESVLDPEFLISTSLRSPNAIHYGDPSLLPVPVFKERRPGDTKLW